MMGSELKSRQEIDDLLSACRTNDKDSIAKILLEPNLADYANELFNALSIAIQLCNVDIVKLLLEKEEVISQAANYQNRALELAVAFGNIEIFKELLKIPALKQNAAFLNNAILRQLAYRGDLERVQLLLAVDPVRDNASVLYNKALRSARIGAHTEIVNLLLTLPQVQQDNQKSILKEIQKMADDIVEKRYLSKEKMKAEYQKERALIYLDVLKDEYLYKFYDQFTMQCLECSPSLTGIEINQMFFDLIREIYLTKLKLYDAKKEDPSAIQTTTRVKASEDLRERLDEIFLPMLKNINPGKLNTGDVLNGLFGYFTDIFFPFHDEQYDADYDVDYILSSLIQDLSSKLVRNTHADDYGYTPLHIAAQLGHVDKIDYFLKNCRGDDILLTNFENMNILHIAAMFNQEEIIKLLLNSPFKSKLNTKDLYGRTAYDIAVQMGNDQAINLLSEQLVENVSELPGYANELDISQFTTEGALIDYLNQKGIRSEGIVQALGNCNGWEFMQQVYVTLGNEEEYYAILETIASWDGTTKALKNKCLGLLAEKYKDVEQLFEQVINDLVVFHGLSKAASELNLGLTQNSREKQYELIKDATLGRKFKNIFNMPVSTYSREQLIEVMTLLSQWPMMSFDLKTSNHSVSLYITPDGKFKLYDPNYRLRIPDFDSAQELVDHLIKFTFKPGGVMQSQKVKLAIYGNKFYNRNEMIPQIEVPSRPLENLPSSPNRYTDLHLAIMKNDTDKANQILEKSPLMFFAPNAHGVSPLRLAINFRNEEMIKLLIMKAYEMNMTHKEIANTIDFVELCTAGDQLVNSFLKEGWLDIDDTDANGNTLLVSALCSQNEKIVKTLLSQKAWALNQYDIHGNAVINYALGLKLPSYELLENEAQIEENEADKEDNPIFTPQIINPKIIKMLLKDKNLEINILDSIGFTPLMTALEYRLDKAIICAILSHPQLNINKQSVDGNSALMTAIQFYPDPEIINLLLTRGASTDLKNLEGKTAYDLALDYPHLAGDPILMEKLKVYRQKSSPWNEPQSAMSHRRVKVLTEFFEKKTKEEDVQETSKKLPHQSHPIPPTAGKK